jgi:hypothetical protein
LPKTVVKLPFDQGLLDERFAKDHSVFGKRQSIRHCSLRERNASDTIGHARKVEDLKDQVDPVFGPAQKPSLTLAQFNFSRRDRAGRDFVFKAADEVVELAIVATARNEKKG